MDEDEYDYYYQNKDDYCDQKSHEDEHKKADDVQRYRDWKSDQQKPY